MNLEKLNDQALVSQTMVLVREERELLTQVLHHFREIDRRKLFFGFWFSFVVSDSEDQASRRITAMRLIRELPEVEEKIASGGISLTHIGLANSLFRQEKKSQNELSREEKLEVFQKMEHKSVREAEKLTLSLSSNPVPPKPDQIRSKSAQHIEIQFSARPELRDKIESLKGLLAHQHPQIGLSELFEKLCDLGLETWRKDQKKTAAPRKAQGQKEGLIAKAVDEIKDFADAAAGSQGSSTSQAPEEQNSSVSKKISKAEMRRLVFQRAQPYVAG